MFEWLLDLIRALRQTDSAQLTSSSSENWEHLRPKSIDEYRQKFMTAPIGCWSQAVGTFSCVNDEIWEFYPDRTGRVIGYRAFSGDRRDLLFEWKEKTAFTIACRVTKWPEDPDTEDLETDRQELEEWQIILYDFKTIPTDVGEIIGMYEITSDVTIKEGFWLSLEPLSFSTDLLN
jgi:hypothetical protein